MNTNCQCILIGVLSSQKNAKRGNFNGVRTNILHFREISALKDVRKYLSTFIPASLKFGQSVSKW